MYAYLNHWCRLCIGLASTNNYRESAESSSMRYVNTQQSQESVPYLRKEELRTALPCSLLETTRLMSCSTQHLTYFDPVTLLQPCESGQVIKRALISCSRFITSIPLRLRVWRVSAQHAAQHLVPRIHDLPH